jgi:hypothetical protein
MLAFMILGGAWTFLGVVLLLGVGVVVGYTRTGSGIAQRPYGGVVGDAPGAAVPSSLGSDRFVARDYSRGTR